MRMMLFVPPLVGAIILSSAAAAATLKREPPMGALKQGQVVYVDDGTCPAGQIKKVTGGNHVKVGGTQHVERSRTCVPR